MATPQLTVRVDRERRTRWQDCAAVHGYDVSGLIRALMDAAVEGSVQVPPHEKDGRCRFGGKADCTQPHKVYDWARICETCGARD